MLDSLSGHLKTWNQRNILFQFQTIIAMSNNSTFYISDKYKFKTKHFKRCTKAALGHFIIVVIRQRVIVNKMVGCASDKMVQLG